MLAGACVILFGYMSMVAYAFRRSRPTAPSANYFLVGGGLVFPIVSMALLLGFALDRGEALSARPAEGGRTIDVQAAQWTWIFTYSEGQQTQNILHVPAGEPFLLSITSADVIHSFWVPRLGGKMDAIPGRTNFLRLTADAPGVYHGICSEFCGIGHAEMRFEVHAHRADEYAARLAEAANLTIGPPVATPRDEPVSEQIGETVRRVLDGGTE